MHIYFFPCAFLPIMNFICYCTHNHSIFLRLFSLSRQPILVSTIRPLFQRKIDSVMHTHCDEKSLLLSHLTSFKTNDNVNTFIHFRSVYIPLSSEWYKIKNLINIIFNSNDTLLSNLSKLPELAEEGFTSHRGKIVYCLASRRNDIWFNKGILTFPRMQIILFFGLRDMTVCLLLQGSSKKIFWEKKIVSPELWMISKERLDIKANTYHQDRELSNNATWRKWWAKKIPNNHLVWANYNIIWKKTKNTLFLMLASKQVKLVFLQFIL